MPDQKPRISAEGFSSLIDVAGAVGSQASQFRRGVQQSSLSDSPPTILVRNDTEDVVPRFGILGIADPLIAPTDNLDGFQSRIAFSGVLPVEGEHENAFVILIEPLADGVIGKATLTGVSPVQIDVSDEAHTHAVIKTGVVDSLQSAEEGTNRILWKEAGTGLKWGVVRMGEGGMGGAAETKDFMYVGLDTAPVAGDYILCRLPETAGTSTGDVTAVAKPWLLRRTPFDANQNSALIRANIKYFYTDGWRRHATLQVPDGETQNEVITPSYFYNSATDQGDIIHAEKRNTGLVTLGGVPITWLEAPNQRAFAKETG